MLPKKTNGAYAIITASELGLQNVTSNVINVNIQRNASTGYHFVTGFGWEGSNLYVYFDGAIDTNVDVYFAVTYHVL